MAMVVRNWERVHDVLLEPGRRKNERDLVFKKNFRKPALFSSPTTHTHTHPGKKIITNT